MNPVSLVLVLGLALAAVSNVEGATNKVVCYYGNWAAYRPGNGKFEVEDIDPTLCTHLIYSFVGLNADNTIKILDEWNAIGKGGFKKFVGLKSQKAGLKTMVAIGGWNEGSEKYSQMAASAASRKTFIQSAVSFLSNYGFDGLDLDWEYPANRGGSASDKANFASLIKELRAEFDKKGYLVTAAVGAPKSIAETAYDIPALSQYLHFINMMAYDYHASWDGVTGHNAPLYASPLEKNSQELNIDATIKYWTSKGAAADKIVLGMGMYGRSFTLSNPASNGLGAPVSGAGTAGPYTAEAGMLGYNEICEKQKTESWKVVRDSNNKSPYAYNGNQWVGYDDVQSIKDKANYAKSKGLGGGMVWSMDTDDFRGICFGTKYPLLRAIKSVISP